MNRFLAVFFARNLEFFRDKATLFWNILFPVFLIVGFSFIFSNNNRTVYKAGYIGKPEADAVFFQYRHIQFIAYPDLTAALDKLKRHQLDMVIDLKPSEYYINSDDPNGYLLEKIILSDTSLSLNRKTVAGKPIRYIDWFVPGVIGMNIMFGCLMGVGFVIIRYRKNGVLKRFKATPLRSWEFVTAQLFSRFFIIALMSVVIFAGTNLFLHFRMEGSYVDLLLITLLAILCHVSLGLVFASRIKSEELASGLINILIWPMMIFSGIFFSMEGTPLILQTLAQVFPITHFLEASRKIMLEGIPLWGVLPHAAYLTGTSILFLIAGSLMFKWE